MIVRKGKNDDIFLFLFFYLTRRPMSLKPIERVHGTYCEYLAVL